MSKKEIIINIIILIFIFSVIWLILASTGKYSSKEDIVDMRVVYMGYKENENDQYKESKEKEPEPDQKYVVVKLCDTENGYIMDCNLERVYNTSQTGSIYNMKRTIYYNIFGKIVEQEYEFIN